MATFRVGVGSFNIQDGAVGFGTDTDGLGNLKVKGVTKTTDIKVSGASTLTRYSGFAADNIDQLENITLTSEVGTIGDIVVGVGTSVIISSGSTVTVGTVESVSIGTHFSPPTGSIEERGQDFVEGMMRFNIDLNTMEFYNGNEWRQFTYIADIQNSPGSRGRGFAFGGYQVPVAYSTIRFVEIATQGNARNFGDLSASTRMSAAFGNTTRGIHGCLYPSNLANIDYITIASEGNAIDWGADRTTSAQQMASLASSTRGIFAGGASSNVIDFIEISTTGNATDFGDISNTRRNTGGFASPTRGVISAGGEFGVAHFKSTDFITIASKGNATDAGDLIGNISGVRTCSNHTRGIFMGGYNPVGSIDDISFMTTASLGNAIDFGNLTAIRREGSCVSNQTRAVYIGGNQSWPNTGFTNVIQFITIATGGDATDFGDDLLSASQIGGGCSDSHGGLGGY